MPTPVHVEQSEMRAIEVALPEGTGPASLLVEAEGGRCAFAKLDEAGEAPLLDAALASWLSDSGRAVSVTRAGSTSPDEALPCEGLPPVERLTVPGPGWALGLAAPAERVDAAGELVVLPVGEDGRWWFVAGRGEASLAFSHGASPPTRFALHFGDARDPVGSRQVIPRSGALAIDLHADPASGPIAVQLANATVVEARIDGSWLVLLGRAAGPVDGVVRVGDGPPEPLHLEVGAPLSPSNQEISIPAGRMRTLKLDAIPDSLSVADGQLVTIELRGQKVYLRGVSPGRTHLLIRQGPDLFLVPLAIGH